MNNYMNCVLAHALLTRCRWAGPKVRCEESLAAVGYNSDNEHFSILYGGLTTTLTGHPSIIVIINKDALHRTQCESIETTVRTRRLLWAGALLRMGDHRLPKRVMSGELENAGKRGPGGKEKEWTDCVADDLRLFGVTGDWKTAALDPGAWYNTVHEGGCRFMAAWVREEENASNQRQKKRDAEEADKVEVAPGVTVASLRRFRTALIGPTQGLPKRRRLCH